MATEKDYMDIKNGSEEGRLVIDRLQQFLSVKASNGSVRASLLQLPSLVDRTTAESFAVTYGIFATSDEDPILLIRDKIEHKGKYAVAAVAPEVPLASVSVGLSADEMEELLALRSEKSEREEKTKARISLMNATRAKSRANV